MADILIHSTVPSRFTHTESSSSVIVDSSTEGSSTSSTTNNKYIGNVNRLRNVFTQNAADVNHYRPVSDENSHNNNTMPNENLSLTNNDHKICFRKVKETVEIIGEETKQNNEDIPIDTTNSNSHEEEEDVTYAIVNRRYSNSEHHYDFPADAVEQLKKQQRDVIDTKSVNEQITTRILPSFVPSNVFKRMDHLNTIFVKPTKIERQLPKLVFQENENEESSLIDQQSSLIENLVFDDSDYVHDDSRPSSPDFYEKPGIPEVEDDTPNGTRRVKFSNAPIRVYPTYSSSEYDRRNEDIDPFSASAEYELEKRIEKMDIFYVDIEKGSGGGLGMSVLGMGVGADNGLEKLGIFVKYLNPQGTITKDGRIQVGDQIIEVDGHSLVGVTHLYATNILKATSGSVKFIIGREKEIGKSEILELIHRSLEMDQERNDSSRTFPKSHERHDINQIINEDDQMEQKLSNEYLQMEILKQCYQSLESSLEHIRREKEYYQQLYEQTQNDFKIIEDKYFKARIIIREFEDREIELHRQQMEINEQHDNHIRELTKKIEELEKTLASSLPNLYDNSSYTTIEPIVSHPPDIFEREPALSPINPGPLLFPPNRNKITTPFTRLPFTSLAKSTTRSQPIEQDQLPRQIHSTTTNNQSANELHVESQIDTTRSQFLSNRSLDDTLNNPNYNTSIVKVPSLEPKKIPSTTNDNNSDNRYIEVKEWSLDHCIQWLTAQQLTIFIPIFLNRNIDGEKLLLLDSTKMKAMGIKSSKDRDQLKTKIKELKHAELDRTRERHLGPQPISFHRSILGGNRFRSSSLSKLKERKLFCGSDGK